MNRGELDGFEWDAFNVLKVESRMDPMIVESAFKGNPLMGEDQIHGSSEKRWFLINRVFARHVFAIFTIRIKKIRVISARYMHKREVKKYEFE
jgi:uncharacterized protein